MPQPTFYDEAESRGSFADARKRLSGARRTPFWIDDLGTVTVSGPLRERTETDLLVVGGGFTGLWTALRSKERFPARDVVLIEGQSVGWAASGRNGGFCEPSLTHGRSNASIHVPGEEKVLEELGKQNLAELLATLERYGIDCDVRPSGVIKLATERHQESALESAAKLDKSVQLLRGEQLQAQVQTPAASMGAWFTDEGVLLNPARLVQGLKDVCLSLGVRIFESTPGTGLRDLGAEHGIRVSTPEGDVEAKSVALATNGFPALLRRDRLHTVPVYDYAIVTEPLTGKQRAGLGWSLEQGVTDMNSRFHYIRLLTDRNGSERLLIGGYDAIYHYGRRIRPEFEAHEPTFERLVVHLDAVFPQLAGIRVSHAWGGMIDTCSRFFAFFTCAYGGRVVSAAGFTGLGVAATRFAADVMLDLLEKQPTERTRTSLVKSRPIPFSPEPFAWLGIRITTAMMVRSDRRRGKKGIWLRLMEKFKMGFDS